MCNVVCKCLHAVTIQGWLLFLSWSFRKGCYSGFSFYFEYSNCVCVYNNQFVVHVLIKKKSQNCQLKYLSVTIASCYIVTIFSQRRILMLHIVMNQQNLHSLLMSHSFEGNTFFCRHVKKSQALLPLHSLLLTVRCLQHTPAVYQW